MVIPEAAVEENERMTVTDEAVEAAARALCSLAGYEWDARQVHADIAADFRSQLLEQARTILEAAAPYMLAEAWDDGEAAGQDNADSNRGHDIAHKYNPYRS